MEHWMRKGERGHGGKTIGRLAAVLLLAIIAGCARAPAFIPEDQRKPIDRRFVDYPNGMKLQEVAHGLTAPSAICVVNEEGEYNGSLLVAESGAGDNDPRIYGW